LTGKSPYRTPPRNTVEITNFWENNPDGFKLDRISNAEIRGFLAKCLAPEPGNRPPIGEVITFLSEKCDRLGIEVDAGKIRAYLKNFRNKELLSERMTRLANEGNPDAMYLQAIGVSDPIQSASLLKTAADAGSSYAAFRYAVTLQFGSGIPRQERLAAEYYEKVIAKEKTTPLAHAARNNLAGLIELGVIKGQKRFFSLYEEAANGGVNRAFLNLARCYEQGIGCTSNSPAAEKWKKKAEEAGVTELKGVDDSGLAVVARALANGKLVEAVIALEEAANGGIGEAKFALGAIFRDDELLREAADAGIPGAQVNLAIKLVADGKNEAGAELLKKAAESGHPYGQYNYAIAIEKGVAAGSTIEVVEWYRKAGEAGFPEAMQAYADCLEEGTGVQANPKLAAEWYRRALEASKGRLTDSDIAIVRLKDK
jgi:TPR repeat protein